jgi:hypothetical protein
VKIAGKTRSTEKFGLFFASVHLIEGNIQLGVYVAEKFLRGEIFVRRSPKFPTILTVSKFRLAFEPTRGHSPARSVLGKCPAGGISLRTCGTKIPPPPKIASPHGRFPGILFTA